VYLGPHGDLTRIPLGPKAMKSICSTHGQAIQQVVQSSASFREALYQVRSKLGLAVTEDMLRNWLHRQKVRETLQQTLPGPSVTPEPSPAQEWPPPPQESPEPPPDPREHEPDSEEAEEQPKPNVWERAPSTSLEVPPPRSGCWMIVGDLHFPYEDKAKVETTLKVLSDLRPRKLIINGDAFDFCQGSHFEQEPSRYKAHLQYEWDWGRYFFREASRWVEEDIIYLLGNHEDRMTRIMFANPATWEIRALDLRTAAELPEKVKVVPYLTKLKAGNWWIFHGSRPGRQFFRPLYVAAFLHRHYKRNLIASHFHRSDYFSTALPEGGLRETFVLPCLADVKQAHYVDDPDWSFGFGVLDFSTEAGRSVSYPSMGVFQGETVFVHGKAYR